MAILCVRTRQRDSRTPSLLSSDLSLHDDLVAAVKNHSVAGLLSCKFYELIDIPFARELRKLGVDHPL